jgi:hypothetical protein
VSWRHCPTHELLAGVVAPGGHSRYRGRAQVHG